MISGQFDGHIPRPDKNHAGITIKHQTPGHSSRGNWSYPTPTPKYIE
jgi:hypothetical protein